jgi:hypothetical protein
MNIVKLTTAKPFKKFISELDSKEIEIVEAYRKLNVNQILLFRQ